MDANVKKDKVIGLIRDSITDLKNIGTVQIDEDEYFDVSEFFDVVTRLCNEFYDREPRPRYYCARIDGTNNLILHEGRGRYPNKTYNIICTDSVAFTGTVGVREVESDGGIRQHIQYLIMFMDQQGIPSIKRVDTTSVDFSSEAQVIDLYMDFYRRLKEYFERYPMAMYDLMTGIKKVYNLPSDGILINPQEYKFIDFDNFKSVDLINNAHKFSYELSKSVPSLKISYEGTKLMHLRTKVDYKSKKFRLRFMMETAKNFFNIFDKFSGDIKNGF